MNETNTPSLTHLQNFWKLISFMRLPANAEDIRILIQVEMMKHYTRAAICRLKPSQIEKYLTTIFVKETNYFCNRSKFLVKDPEIRKVIDLLGEEKVIWYIETNFEGNHYLFVSWQHWSS